MRFEGKVVIVTGAASGIGRCVAQRFAREGASVAIGDVNMAGLEETAGTIESAVMTGPLDVSSQEACDAFVAASVEKFGRLDVLCNIAGVLDLAPLSQLTAKRLERTLGVNLNGVIFMTHAAMPHLVEQRGAVVNMASAAGLVGVPFNSAYSASKHAVIGFTKSIALEFAKSGVRVNAICPTGVNTPMIGGPIPPEVDLDVIVGCSRAWLDNGANCDPDDIADAVTFLASSQARRVTGVAFPVDGGQTAA